MFTIREAPDNPTMPLLTADPIEIKL